MPSSTPQIYVMVDIPSNGPFTNWKVFKDYVRHALKVSGQEPGWTELEVTGEGTFAGWTACRSNTDALLVYEFLENLIRSYWPDYNFQMNIHWYDVKSSGYQPIRCNCGSNISSSHKAYWKHHVRFLDPSLTMGGSMAESPVSGWSSNVGLTQLTNGMQNLAVNQQYYSQHPGYAVQPAETDEQQSSSAQDAHVQYVTNSQGHRVNTTNGVVESEHNVVLLRNLDPRVTDAEVKGAISKAVRPVSVQVRRQHLKKSTITALATFDTHRDARKVVDHFNSRDCHLRSRTIQAEFGKESKPIGSPIIVNGSKG